MRASLQALGEKYIGQRYDSYNANSSTVYNANSSTTSFPLFIAFPSETVKAVSIYSSFHLHKGNTDKTA